MVRPVCPHCEVALERRSSNGVFRYSCPSCYGFSVHFGALKKIVEPSEVGRMWAASEKADSNSSMKCPHCRGSTSTIFHGHDVPIELDVCRRCHIVWLDTGEWKDIEKLPKFKRPKAEQEFNRVYADALLQLENEKYRSDAPGGIRTDDYGEATSIQWATALLGLPTETDNGFLKVTPWITGTLVLSCLVFSSLAFKNMPAAIEAFGYLASAPKATQFVTSITSFFIHGGWMHLLGNMYFLWVFGDNVEDHLGHSRYALLLLLSTLMGSMVFGRFDPNAMTIPAIGASGGIAGVVAYYLVKFPFRRFFVVIWFRMFSFPAMFLGVLFLFRETLGALVEMNRTGGGVAHLAHLGGAVVGVIWALVVAPERVSKS